MSIAATRSWACKFLIRPSWSKWLWTLVRRTLPGWGLAAWALAAGATPAFDTSSPASFFTNVADRVLLDETANWRAQDFAGFTNAFGATITNAFGLGHLPVYINGTFVYSPSVQRLLQVTANIFEATSTNPYPAVYRPTFYRDPATGNVFINGYQVVASVSGLGDDALAQPLDIAPIASGAVAIDPGRLNIYGVPWIIGARRGFPGFNELNMLNVVQVTRMLQFTRPTPNPAFTSLYTTNQLFVIGITNNLGVSLWNSYATNYTSSGNLTVFVQDIVRMVLTNNLGYYYSQTTNFNYFANFGLWPGSGWTSATPGVPAPVPASFLTINWAFPFLPLSAYHFQNNTFVPTSVMNPPFETNDVGNPPVPLLPQFGLATTNWLQAFVLDGPVGAQHVIDYVQFTGPNRTRNLHAELSDPIFPDATRTPYMWSTNAYGLNGGSSPAYGVVNQIMVSQGLANPPFGGTWPASTPSLPTVAAETAYFQGFWAPTWSYAGIRHTNTDLIVRAPYLPTRTLYSYDLWVANDPLVHYQTSDLNYYDPTLTGLQRSDSVPPVMNVPGLNLQQISTHYQPWGMVGLMQRRSGVDTNACNLAYKDPLVWGSDSWNFPTNQTWNPNWLGQVHRGTPWQSMYLKATDILQFTNSYPSYNAGTNTWRVWSGVPSVWEAQHTSPVNDWHLASLLCALLNTNPGPAFFSVNNPDASAWTVPFDGLNAMTNSASDYSSPLLTPIVLSSNSPAVASLAGAIQVTRAGEPGGQFLDVGDVLATPALSVQSPFLNTSDPLQQKLGITDAAYEALPSQLLGQLGVASLGTLALVNGEWLARFSGRAGQQYILQSSTDLVHWTAINTNSPVNGRISVTVPAGAGGMGQFYRSQLVR